MVLAPLAAVTLAACFAAPQPVLIDGWTADAMEPFITRDGAALFFNSSNAPGAHTDIYWAKRVGPLRFAFQGTVPGADSPALDGVPSLAQDGAFALISPRAYGRNHATVWVGRWTGGAVEGLEAQPALTPPGAGGFDMDAEISGDGRRLYLSESRWNPFGPPKTARLRLARRGPQGWRIDPAADAALASLNDRDALQYAAGVSADERELFFTRLPLTHGRPAAAPQIWVATRPDAEAPFSAPARLTALGGFVEGPSVAGDGALYFHQRHDGRFRVMRAARTCDRP